MSPLRVAAFSLAMLAGLAATPAQGAAGAAFQYGRLGPVTLYEPQGPPREVVLFISGDGGWNAGVVEMARHLRDRGALVAGIDINVLARHMQESADGCAMISGDLEAFAHALEARRHFPQYINPILMGYSSGATLAYATLVQAPPGTYKGALSLGFGPSLAWHKPLCRGDGSGLETQPAPSRGLRFLPAAKLQDPWIVMQGAIDQVCDPATTREFVRRTPGARLIELPRVGHGFSVEAHYLPQFLSAYDELAAARAPATARSASPAGEADISGLPLVEVPASGPQRDLMAIMLSGDGGWAGLDAGVAAELAARGIAVVGWDSLRYFWEPKTAERGAADLDRIIRHYTTTWHRPRVLAIGYSMGADTLPFMINRLPAPSRSRITLVALLAPGDQAFFEFHFAAWLGAGTGGLPVSPELVRLAPTAGLCIYGRDEQSISTCGRLPHGTVRPVALPGGHHFDGDYPRLAHLIAEAGDARQGPQD